MAREPKCRRVESVPKVTVFKPSGIPRSTLEEVIVKIEELEAIRLKDLLGLEQEECAKHMGISRPTFQRILLEVREKIASALIEGKAIRFGGGNYCLGQEHCRRLEHALERRDDCFYLEDYTEGRTVPGGNIEEPIAKIAICVSGESTLASVDGHFGRCPYFALWNEEQGSFGFIRNFKPDNSQGAGIESAKELLSRRVEFLICNRIGPKAFTVFQRAGVKLYYADEGINMETALKQYQNGELNPIEAANNL